jgi:hypothetical protein
MAACACCPEQSTEHSTRQSRLCIPAGPCLCHGRPRAYHLQVALTQQELLTRWIWLDRWGDGVESAFADNWTIVAASPKTAIIAYCETASVRLYRPKLRNPSLVRSTGENPA